MVSVLARRSVAACALPRPSATASARLAKTTVSHSQTDDQPGERPTGRDRQDGGEHRADLDDEHHRVAPQGARVELAQRVRQRPQQLPGVEQAAADPVRARAGRRRRVALATAVTDGRRRSQWSQAFGQRAERERREVGQARRRSR